jgi:DNA-binding NarL/FixJ family response regulator
MLPLQANPKTKLHVHLIEPNPLLRKLILQKLKTDLRIRLIAQQKISATLTTTGQQITVLIDKSATGDRFAGILHDCVSTTRRCRVGILDNDDLTMSELCSLISRGVHGFLAFTRLSKELIPAIQALNRGELWFTPRVLDHYIRGVNSLLLKRGTGQGIALTFRQEQITALACKGLSNKEIGVALNISENTVKFHLRKVFVKRGVQDRRLLMLQTTPNAVATEHPKLRTTGVA